MTPYRIWRRQLHELQEKIQAYDEDITHYESESAYQEWKKNRKPMEDEINAHHEKIGDAIEETENQNP